MMRNWIGFLLIGLVACEMASARNIDDTLGMIVTPNNGLPALILPGGEFEVTLKDASEEEVRLTLEQEGDQYPLTAEWRNAPGERRIATCTAPESIPVGTYSIWARTDTREDHIIRSVYVRKSFPEYYVLAHVTDVHIGKKSDRVRTPEEINLEVFKAVNESEASFALVTGDVTEVSEPDEFRRFIKVLNTCTLPTFVCVGNHDRELRNYQAFFGPLTYAFFHGRDGYLLFDTKDFRVADTLGNQDGLLEIYRQALKPARWSIGVAHRYEPMMGIRSQLTLFVDNPLDYMLYGHTHREPRSNEGKVRWGTTELIMTPAAIDGRMRLIDVSAQGLRPRPTTQVIEVQHKP